MKSIGDFALNIIPNIDTIKLNTGITALDSLSNIAGKVWDVFKGAYGVVDNTAEKLRNLAYIGKELNMPAEQIKVMENTMRLFGLNSAQAAEALKSIAKFRGGAPFGEFDTGLIMKAGLMPTDFGKDWKKNLELLSKKYTSTDNVNVRSAIAQLAPGLERMLTDPSRLSSYIADAQKRTDLMGVNWKGIEDYGKKTGEMSIALDNLATALSNAALPGLTKAVAGLTEFLSKPEVKAFIHKVGGVVGGTGRAVEEVGKLRPFGGVTDFFKEGIPYLSKEMGVPQFFDILKSAWESLPDKPKLSSEYTGLNPIIEITNHSDGSHIETTIKQVNSDKSKRVIQNDPGGKL